MVGLNEDRARESSPEEGEVSSPEEGEVSASEGDKEEQELYARPRSSAEHGTFSWDEGVSHGGSAPAGWGVPPQTGGEFTLVENFPYGVDLWGQGRGMPVAAPDFTVTLQRCCSLQELAIVVRGRVGESAHAGSLNHREVNVAAGCLAKLRWEKGSSDGLEVFGLLRGQIRKVLGEIDERTVTHVLHSMAKLHTSGRVRDFGGVVGDLLHQMEVMLKDRGDNFKAINVSMAIWALAKMEVQLPPPVL